VCEESKKIFDIYFIVSVFPRMGQELIDLGGGDLFCPAVRAACL
jgi:hypothetical protein